MKLFDTDKENVIVLGNKYENYKDNLDRPVKLSIIFYSSMILDLINNENIKEIILQFTNDKQSMADYLVARYKKMLELIKTETGPTKNKRGSNEFIVNRYILKKSDFFT